MIDRGFPVLLVAPSGRVLADLVGLAETLERPEEPSSIAISDDDAVLGRARVGLPLPPGMPEWVSPIVAVVSGPALGGRPRPHPRPRPRRAPRPQQGHRDALRRAP